MIRPLRTRLVAPLLAATLGLTVSAGLTATPAFAQNEPVPAEGEGDTSGRPLDGYLATGCLVGLALFLVAKSARRQ
jgi:hypothetical protein